MLPLHLCVDSKSAYFACRWRHRPTPWPLAFDLLTPQHLIILGLLGQNTMFLCHYAEQKRITDNKLVIFIFFLLFLVSPSTICLYKVRFMCMLCLFFSVFGEFQAPPIGLEYELQRVEWFSMDSFGRKYSWNNAKEDRGKKDCFGTWPQLDRDQI